MVDNAYIIRAGPHIETSISLPYPGRATIEELRRMASDYIEVASMAAALEMENRAAIAQATRGEG